MRREREKKHDLLNFPFSACLFQFNWWSERELNTLSVIKEENGCQKERKNMNYGRGWMNDIIIITNNCIFFMSELSRSFQLVCNCNLLDKLAIFISWDKNTHEISPSILFFFIHFFIRSLSLALKCSWHFHNSQSVKKRGKKLNYRE